MQLSALCVAALRELGRRHPPEPSQERTQASQALAEAAATSLRAPFYRKQRRLFGRDRTRRKRATKKTRRAGATAGGVRELLARALEQPGFRASYVTDTAKNARSRAWKNDTKSGFIDVLRAEARAVKHRTLTAYEIGGVVILVRDGELVLDFANGSQIELFGADSIGDHTKRRGHQKHVMWVDEAQDFPYLEEFYTAVVVGCLTDWRGEAWFTGTPGKDCAGMFYEITKEEEHERLPGWDVNIIAATDNPFFGTVIQADDGYWVQWKEADEGKRAGPFDTYDDAEAAAVDIRFANSAEQAKIENHWTGDEPDYVREQLGRWVKSDARYVYPVHAVPDHQLLFAPQRLVDNPFVGSDPRFNGHPRWYDHHRAVLDLPRKGRDGRAHKWLYSLWLDDGFFPDPFAIVLWAFTPTLRDVYEMFSWKMTRVDADDKGAYVKLLYDSIPEVVSFGGDPSGMKGDFAVWKRRLNLPVEEAEKSGKNQLEEHLANDVRRGHVHLRDDSPLHNEMKHLVYLPTKPGKPREVHKHRKVAGVIHGDHCCDAGRYGFADLTHYLAKVAEERPPAGSRAALMAEAEREEQAVDRREAVREAREASLDEADEYASDYQNAGEYQW